MAAEECKEMLCAQLASLTDELQKTQAIIAEQASEMEKLRARECANSDKDAMIEKLQTDKKTLEHDLEQSNGAYFALKLAHSHLETKLKSSDAARIKKEKEQNSTIVNYLVLIF